MAKPVKWTETWTGLTLWAVPERPRPKWLEGICRCIAGEFADTTVVLFRDTAALRRTLKEDVRPESIKRVRVTVTVEELEP